MQVVWVKCPIKLHSSQLLSKQVKRMYIKSYHPLGQMNISTKVIWLYIKKEIYMFVYAYTDSKESFSSSSFRLGSLCSPKVILRASTCSFNGLYSSWRRRVVSSNLFRSFSDCLMVLSIWKETVSCISWGEHLTGKVSHLSPT